MPKRFNRRQLRQVRSRLQAPPSSALNVEIRLTIFRLVGRPTKSPTYAWTVLGRGPQAVLSKRLLARCSYEGRQ